MNELLISTNLISFNLGCQFQSLTLLWCQPNCYRSAILRNEIVSNDSLTINNNNNDNVCTWNKNRVISTW